jgi:hypothetical protein
MLKLFKLEVRFGVMPAVRFSKFGGEVEGLKLYRRFRNRGGRHSLRYRALDEVERSTQYMYPQALLIARGTLGSLCISKTLRFHGLQHELPCHRKRNTTYSRKS